MKKPKPKKNGNNYKNNNTIHKIEREKERETDEAKELASKYKLSDMKMDVINKQSNKQQQRPKKIPEDCLTIDQKNRS